MGTKLYDLRDWCKRGPEIENYPYIGEIETKVEIGDVLEIDGEYYAPGLIAVNKEYAGVHKIELIQEPENVLDEDQMTCPYCGHKDTDSWELPDSYDEFNCGQCRAVISFEREVTVKYNSSPVKPPNIVKANWI